MKDMTTKSAVLLLVGVLAGIVTVQLLWPLVGEAQGQGQGQGPAWKLEGTLPSMEKQVNTYKNVPPDVSQGRLDNLSRAFGMNGRAVGQEVLALDDGDKSLRLMRDTGAMMYRNHTTAGKAVGSNLPNTGPAGASADKFCRDNNLLPGGSSRSVEVVTSRSQNQENGPTSSHGAEIAVTYSFKLGGKQVEGPGSKAMVTIGDGGTVTSFTRTMPDVEAARMVQTKTAAQAYEELKQKGHWNMLKQAGGPPREIKVKNVRAAYWVEDPGRGAGTIEPCFIFTGTAVDEDGRDVEFMQKVSAVEGQAEPTLPASPTQPSRPQE